MTQPSSDILATEPVRHGDINEAISIGKEQKGQVLQPVPKSWKPVIASKADGSPCIIYVSPKIHDAIVATGQAVDPITPERPEVESA